MLLRHLALIVALILSSGGLRLPPAAAAESAAATLAGCGVLPADNIWNVPVDALPVHANSSAFVNTIGLDAYVHPDFGSGLWDGGPIGIPVTVVRGDQPKVDVTFYYPNESDPGPYPIPANALIEGGPEADGDRHVLVLDRDNCVLYELYDAWPQSDGSWEAGSGAIYDLNSNGLRPEGWTSADAAGLPVLPGLVRYDEVAAGEITHALRFTAPRTRRAYVWPARHFASDLTGAQYPAMGQRFRLRADYDISGFAPHVQVILRALKRYGMILADNGAPWYISGVPDERWDNDVLHALQQVHGNAFEAVDTSSLMVDPDSGRTAAHTYFVSPDGSDANPGTQAAPFASPGYASRQLRAGDTLVILGGRYLLDTFDEDILTPPSGTSSDWVTIRGEAGNRPILAGGNNLIMAIDLSGCSYVRIENLEITHNERAPGAAAYFREGVNGVGDPLSHIVLEDLYIHHLDEFGVDLRDVNDLQMTNCRIEYCGFGAVGGPQAEEGGWRNVRLDGCRLSYSGHYYRGGDGSDRPYDRPDGFGIEPSVGPVTIVSTTAEHNFGDGLDSKAANTLIRGCIVANNSCDGVKLWGSGSRVRNTLVYGRGDGDSTPTPWAAIVIGASTPNATFELTNVTVDDALGDGYLMYAQYDQANVPISLTIRNCVFRATGPRSSLWIAGSSTLSADHNLFYLPATDHVLTHGAQTYTGVNIATLGAGNAYGDPDFVAPAWGEPGYYRLAHDSPAIDSGNASAAPTTDLDGLARDAQPDRGAFEYVSTVFSMNLSAGWNLLSLPVVPTSTAPSDVLHSVAGDYALVMAYDATTGNWRSFDPSLPPAGQTLTALDQTTAFWLRMDRRATLTLAGALPGSTEQTLSAGWNLVAFPAQTTKAVPEALDWIAGDYSAVWEYVAEAPNPWRMYGPSVPPWANTLAALEPGRGYWIQATRDGVLRLGP